MMVSRQKGIALITALLIVTLATIAAVSITAELQREIRRSGNILQHDQAYVYAIAAEDFARYGLKLDFDDNKTDHLYELWHTIPVAEDIQGGALEGKLDDLQGLFNLNSLANNKALDKDRFERILRNLDVAPAEIQQITAALLDWLDADQISQPAYGAEDDYYLGLAEPQKPHLAANQLLSSLSELRLIKGFNDEILTKLRIKPAYEAVTGELLEPVFTVLPEASTSININTAPVEVLKSLDIKITDTIAQDIITKRQGDALNNGSARPFKSVDEFKSYLDSLSVPAVDIASLSVATDYFSLKAKVLVGNSNLYLSSLIKRESTGLSNVISRNQGAN
ncbi:MAG: type II secretion system minor pseudopilin GspK [Gammaproteobacteria bacterium]|nr:type II secretion system minor pseudopilin GspK [Gammaproteobacteria bacterium]